MMFDIIIEWFPRQIPEVKRNLIPIATILTQYEPVFMLVILEAAFPDRVIAQIRIDGIASEGGSIHCATQQ